MCHPDRSGGIARRLRRACDRLGIRNKLALSTFFRPQFFERRVPEPDQCQLLASAPALDLLLALDGSQRIIKLLVVDEPLDSIFSGETLDQSVFVFVHSALQMRRYSDVKYSTTARESINVKLAHPPLGTLTDGRRERQMVWPRRYLLRAVDRARSLHFGRDDQKSWAGPP